MISVKKTFQPPLLEDVIEVCLGHGLTKRDAEYFHSLKTENGWKNGSRPIKDLKRTIRTWERGGFFPSQKGVRTSLNRDAKPKSFAVRQGVNY